MDKKGITWVGNVYQQFENMCLEVEEMMLEDTLKYIENQVQTIGENIKKIYSDVIQDFLPPSSCSSDEKVASELPKDQHTAAGLCETPFQGSQKLTVKADSKETTEDSWVDHDVDTDTMYDGSFDADGDSLFKSASGDSVFGNNFTSHATWSTDIISSFGRDESQQNEQMSASKTVSEITLIESDACSTSQSRELHGNQIHADSVTVPNPSSAEVTLLASEALLCNEIEHASTEHISDPLILVKSAEEQEMNEIYSSPYVLYGNIDWISLIRATEREILSHNTTVVSQPENPETWSSDESMDDTIYDDKNETNDTVYDDKHGTTQQNNELNLEETCVMVTRDELQSAPNTRGNLETNKEKWRQPFSLSKKSARKQEYEDLAIWHGNNEQGKGDDTVQNSYPTLLEDQNELLLPDTSDESEWELL